MTTIKMDNKLVMSAPTVINKGERVTTRPCQWAARCVQWCEDRLETISAPDSQWTERQAHNACQQAPTHGTCHVQPDSTDTKLTSISDSDSDSLCLNSQTHSSRPLTPSHLTFHTHTHTVTSHLSHTHSHSHISPFTHTLTPSLDSVYLAVLASECKFAIKRQNVPANITYGCVHKFLSIW